MVTRRPVPTLQHYLVVYRDCGCVKAQCACTPRGGQLKPGPRKRAPAQDRTIRIPGRCPTCEATR